MEKCEFYELDAYLKESNDQLNEQYGITEPYVPAEIQGRSYPEILDQCCSGFCKWMIVGEFEQIGKTEFHCTNPNCPHAKKAIYSAPSC